MLFSIYKYFVFVDQLIWQILFIDFQILTHPCTPTIDLTWLWYITLLMCYVIALANILFRVFASIFIPEAGILCTLGFLFVFGLVLIGS